MCKAIESNSIHVQSNRYHDQSGKHTVICVLACVCWGILLLTCMQIHACINMLDFNAKSWVILGYVWAERTWIPGSLVESGCVFPLAHIFRFSFCEKELIYVIGLVLMCLWEVNPCNTSLQSGIYSESTCGTTSAACSFSYHSEKLIMRARAPPFLQWFSPKMLHCFIAA